MLKKWYFSIIIVGIISFFVYNYISFREQPPAKIGVIMIGESRLEKLEGLKNGMKDLGYEENEIDFVVKKSEENEKLLDIQIDELLNENPQVIVTLGGVETFKIIERMEQKKLNVPIVFAGVAAAKEIGVVKDYANPGGLVTGIDNYHRNISGKRLEVFRDLIPSIERFHIIYDDEIELSRLSLENAVEAAGKLKIQIIPWNISEPELMKRMNHQIQENDAILLMPGYRIESILKDIVQFSKENRIPTMGIYEHEVKEGLLVSYGTSFFDQGHQAARHVSLIIQGNSPADIPVEHPDRVSFIINQKIKDDLGIEMNRNFMILADLFTPQDQKEDK